MMGFVYVLWAVEDQLIKVGITKNINRRVGDHSGNSSNPLTFGPRYVFAFDCIDNARIVETELKSRLFDLGFAHRRKKELFCCPPSTANELIRGIATEKHLLCLANFPSTDLEKEDVFDSLFGVPYYLDGVLSSHELFFYRKGLKTAFRLMATLEGATIPPSAFLAMRGAVDRSAFFGIEEWREILLSLSLAMSADQSVVGHVARATTEITELRKESFFEWQQIEANDRDYPFN